MSTDAAPRRLATGPALVALPLVVALLVGSWLLWVRQDPEREGGFCTNVTVEVGTLLRRTEGGADLARDQAGHLQDALARITEVDARRFTTDTPPRLRSAATLVRRDLPAYQREAAAARGDGRAAPNPPDALRGALATIVADYYRSCVQGDG